MRQRQPASGIRDAWRRLGRTLGAAIVTIAVLAAAPAALGAKPEISRTINNHFVTVQHFDAEPLCGPFSIAATEIATGNEHLVIVDQGDSVHVTYGETFHILAVPDDPSVPSDTRQGTDALVFNLLKDGTEIFHESFHDFGAAAWDPFAKIQFFVTFVYRDGEVVVEHQFGRDLPPEGC
jgi:hypothetical protein